MSESSPQFTVYTHPETLESARRDLGIVLSEVALKVDERPVVVTCNKRTRALERLIKGKWQIDVIRLSGIEDWNCGEELEVLSANCSQFPKTIDEAARAVLYAACTAGAQRIPGDEALAIIRGDQA